MFGASKSLLFLAALGILLFAAAAAVADWDEGDGHKMHWPQLPDPNGYDVAWGGGWLGDDWQCSESGPVSDIHLWASFYGYNLIDPPDLSNLTVQIWTNNPTGPDGFSIPYEQKWERVFAPTDFTIRYYGDGNQGWYWPIDYTVDEAGAHNSYFQINIEEISEPFRQEKDEIYWLVTKFDETDPYIGWKTSGSDHFEDDAVFWCGSDWYELEIDGVSRDLAFVITPEPGTVMLLITGGLGLLLFAWRRRRR